jgi:CheY-like chemotaxis protein
MWSKRVEKGTGSRKESQKPKIMVVDDDKEMLAVLTTILERNAYEVDAFSDPREALSRYRQGEYGLVISDFQMPHMNGFELCRAIVKLHPGARLCLFTAFEIRLQEFKAIFPQSSIVGLIRKPISGSDLVEKIKLLLQEPVQMPLELSNRSLIED